FGIFVRRLLERDDDAGLTGGEPGRDPLLAEHGLAATRWPGDNADPRSGDSPVKHPVQNGKIPASSAADAPTELRQGRRDPRINVEAGGVDAEAVSSLNHVHSARFDDSKLAHDRILGLIHLQPNNAIAHGEFGAGAQLLLFELADHEARRIPNHRYFG